MNTQISMKVINGTPAMTVSRPGVSIDVYYRGVGYWQAAIWMKTPGSHGVRIDADKYQAQQEAKVILSMLFPGKGHE